MSIQQRIAEDTCIVASTHQLGSEVAGEAVILNIQSGVYYGLNPVGTKIWSLLQQPTTVNQIKTALLEEYDVDPDICDRDLQNILQELYAINLIEIKK
jgi:Coenzyme PQQ synthesis protein D (PqqD)